ncbi:hypothetical protein MHYP_G00149800 [Metynnis hypsauchen]
MCRFMASPEQRHAGGNNSGGVVALGKRLQSARNAEEKSGVERGGRKREQAAALSSFRLRFRRRGKPDRRVGLSRARAHAGPAGSLAGCKPHICAPRNMEGLRTHKCKQLVVHHELLWSRSSILGFKEQLKK